MGFDNECIVNIQSLPGEFFCPVCRTLVYPNEALQSQCTHLYCKPCLAYIVATTQACPYDGFLVTEADSKPLSESDKSVAETIGKVAVHCLYHRSGCQWQGTLMECTVHSTDCNFGNSLVVCNRCGAQIIHRQVQEHAQSCPGLQPQTHQAEGIQAQASSVLTQATTLDSASAALASVAAPTVAATAVPAATDSVTPATAAAATSTTAAAPSSAVASVQTQTVAQTPTPDQWYQQQLQYQQYYQQYPGYDPYQQQYQQHGQHQQQQVYQNYPQASAPTQQVYHSGQPVPYLVPQSQPQPHSQPQTQPQAPPRPPPQQPFPQAQPQLQHQPQPQPEPQTQPQPQIQAYPHPRPSQMPVSQAHAPPQQAQPQLQLQSFPAPLQHLPHSQMQPPPQTQPPASVQPLPNMQMQHPQVQPHFQHPPQPNLLLPSRPQLQPQPMPQTQPGAAVTGFQSYPQPQQFQQFSHNTPQQPPMQMSMQPHGPAQQRPQPLPQLNPQMWPPQSPMPMHSSQQPTTMPPQGPWPMQQQQPHNMPPNPPSQPPQYASSMRPPIQQQLPHQPYQQAMHPPSHPQGMPPHQHNLRSSHQPEAGRLMMPNQGMTQQALQQSVGMNQQVQGNLVSASPAVQPGITGQDMLDSKQSPKVTDANKASNLVNGLTEVSESADVNEKDGEEKPLLSDMQISGRGSDSLAKDGRVGEPEIKHEDSGEEGDYSKAKEPNEYREQDGVTNIKKEAVTEEKAVHPSSMDKGVVSSKVQNMRSMQQQAPAHGLDRGFPLPQPDQDSIPGHNRLFTQPGYLDKNIAPAGPNSVPGRYPPHHVPLGNQPANQGPGFAPHGRPLDKSFIQQMPYPGQDRKFMDSQLHQLPPPPGTNQMRPPMQHLPESFPPQGMPAPASGAPVHPGPPRGFDQPAMPSQLHESGHVPPSYDGRLRVSQGGPVVPPVMSGPPPRAFNILPGPRGGEMIPDDHPRRSNYPLEGEAHVMKNHPFFDGKGPLDSTGLHNLEKDRLRPNPDGRFRPLPEESLQMAPQDRVMPSMFEEELKRFPQPSHLNGDPNFEAYASSSRPLDRGPQPFGYDLHPSSLDRTPYGADGGFGLGERRNAFVPPDNSERFRAKFGFGRHHLDGLPPARSPARDYSDLPSKFGSISQYYNGDFGWRDLHGASVFQDSRVSKHLGPGSSLLPPHIQRGDLDYPDNIRMSAPDFPRTHFHEPFGRVFPTNLRKDEAFRVGDPGFGRSYSLGDSFEHARKRKQGSMGWCLICKIDCETVEGLDMHSQTREHQMMTMDLVWSIKREVSKKKKLPSDRFAPDNAIKTRKANFEHRGTRH